MTAEEILTLAGQMLGGKPPSAAFAKLMDATQLCASRASIRITPHLVLQVLLASGDIKGATSGRINAEPESKRPA